VASYLAGELSRGFVLFQKIGLFFELLGYSQRLLEIASVPARSAHSRYHAANSRKFSASGARNGLFAFNIQSPHSRSTHSLVEDSALALRVRVWEMRKGIIVNDRPHPPA
jgi:hypothetical protein